MKVLGIVRDFALASAVHEDRLDALGMDSLEFIELIRQIEDDCSVVIPDSELATLQTVRDLENLVNRLQNDSLVRG